MQASITSNENRAAGNRIIFEIDEAGYTETGQRTFTINKYIDGTSDIADWSFNSTDIEIGVSGIELTHADYEILNNMKKDNQYSFYFHYRITTFPVIITEISKILETGKNVLAAIRLTVSSTPTEMETS